MSVKLENMIFSGFIKFKFNMCIIKVVQNFFRKFLNRIYIGFDIKLFYFSTTFVNL